MQSTWTWEATATVIQAVATVIALLGVIITFLLALRAERREREKAHADAERADAGAERAERAAALSIDTLTRIAEAIEDLTGRQSPGLRPGTASSRGRVSWTLRTSVPGAFRLENTGSETASAVQVSADPTLPISGLPLPGDIAAGEGVEFRAQRTAQTRDATITVTWSDSADADGPRQTWKYPLPY